MSAIGSRRVNAPNLYEDLLRLLPEEAARRVEPVVRDPKTPTEAKMRALLEPFLAGRTVVLLDNFEDVIDPATHTVVRTFATGKLPQHVVPSYDMRRLWVTNDMDDSLTSIDPATGADGERVRVSDPYNLYFTPDGKLAIVIAEAQHRFDLRDAATMKLVRSVHVDCDGLDHVDFTADDKYAIATCEFSGELVKLDLAARKTVGYLRLQTPAMPQDIRLSPDGRAMYVADMMADGAHVIDPVAFTEVQGRSPFSIPSRRRSWRRGRFRAVGALIWAASVLTVRSCGSRGGTTARSTRSTPRTERSSRGSASASSPTACVCGPSRDDFRWGTLATCGSALSARQPNSRGPVTRTPVPPEPAHPRTGAGNTPPTAAFQCRPRPRA